MGGHRSRLPLAITVAVLAAGAATIILRPRGGLLEPAAVEATEYFTSGEIERAKAFRDPQRILALSGLAVTGVTLALLALRPPVRIARTLERASARPLLGGALAGAGLSLILVLTGLPLALWRHERAVDVGLSTQSLGAWLGDVAKAAGIEALLAAAGGVLALALIRRFPRYWWAPGAGAVVGLAVIFLVLSPVIIEPLFNRFEQLPEGKLRRDVVTLADRAGVDVGEVLRIDASRRTTGANAYVAGLGETKRVVLYDNLLDDFPPDQVRSVVAHELGHVDGRDIPRGILWLAIVAPAATLLVQRLTEELAPPGALEAAGGRAGPAAMPALALALALTGFGVTCAGNVLSREVEARADAYALELTGDPDAFIGLERGLTVRNVGDPDPPGLLHALFGTHPTTVERIGHGVTFRGR